MRKILTFLCLFFFMLQAGAQARRYSWRLVFHLSRLHPVRSGLLV